MLSVAVFVRNMTLLSPQRQPRRSHYVQFDAEPRYHGDVDMIATHP